MYHLISGSEIPCFTNTGPSSPSYDSSSE